MFKKMLSVFLILSVCASLGACSSGDDLDITFKRKTVTAAEQQTTEAETTEAQEEETAAETTEQTTENDTVQYTVNQEVNVRANPDYNSEILGVLSYGETVSVSSTENGWAVIDYNGAAGYVSVDYLSPLS